MTAPRVKFPELKAGMVVVIRGQTRYRLIGVAAGLSKSGFRMWTARNLHWNVTGPISDGEMLSVESKEMRGARW